MYECLIYAQSPKYCMQLFLNANIVNRNQRNETVWLIQKFWVTSAVPLSIKFLPLLPRIGCKDLIFYIVEP